MRDTIEMAREAAKLKCDFCLPYYEETDIEGFEGFLKRFAAIVRADERNKVWSQKHWTEYEQAIVQTEREAIIDLVAMYGGSVDLEAAIRARGETK